jgi:phosphatidylinositol alpha-mannosyltransferase
MRIVQVCPYDPYRHGGVQRNMHALAAALSARGHQTLIVAPGSPVPSQEGVWRLGAMRSVRFAGTRFEVTWAAEDELSRTTQLLRAWKPDVVHFHTPWDPLMPWQLFRRLDVVPRVATFHDTPPTGITGAVLRGLYKVMSRYLLSRLDGAIAVSDSPLGHLQPGASGVRPVVLPPVTDLSPFLALDKREPARPTILFLGRLEPRKGVQVLLEAVALLASGAVPLPASLPQPRVVVAGDGDLRSSVLATQERLGQGWIDFVPAPSQEEQLWLLAEATLAVSPALYGESFGIVLAEALASGTPVIGADNAGYRTVLTGQGSSLLVPVGDAAALARRIAALLVNSTERHALSTWGRAHARQFDVSDRIGDFEDFYASAITRYMQKRDIS